MKYKSPAGQVVIQTLRENPVPCSVLDNPGTSAQYLRDNVAWTFPDTENFGVIFLNTRRRPLGHQIIAGGILDQVLVHAREAFRAAIVANAHSIILFHNHPSGDSTPSDSDIRVTRDLIRAGQLLKIEVLDHIIIGEKTETNRGFSSLRELGYFYSSP